MGKTKKNQGGKNVKIEQEKQIQSLGNNEQTKKRVSEAIDKYTDNNFLDVILDYLFVNSFLWLIGNSGKVSKKIKNIFRRKEGVK